MATWAPKAIRGILSNIADFFYPRLCIICEEPGSEDTGWLCRECISRLQANHQQRQACERCGQNRTIRACACDSAWDQPFESAYSLFDYDDTVQKIAHYIKYRGARLLARDMGRIFSDLIPPVYRDTEAVWMPVPLHRTRRVKRGYNQAEEFARGALSTHIIHAKLSTAALVRTRNTRTQTRLDKLQRQKNLSDAFRVVQSQVDQIRGKSLILIDDVMTTGATAAACARVLIQAGCSSVRVLSMARD